MCGLQRERVFLLALIILVAVAASIAVFAYTMGGTRGTEEWFHSLGRNGEIGDPGVSHPGVEGHGGEPEPVLVVDSTSYLVVLLCLCGTAAGIWLWYNRYKR